MSEQEPEYDAGNEIEKTPKVYRVHWYNGEISVWTDVSAIDFWEGDGVLFLRDENDIVFASRAWTSVHVIPRSFDESPARTINHDVSPGDVIRGGSFQGCADSIYNMLKAEKIVVHLDFSRSGWDSGRPDDRFIYRILPK